MDDQRRLIEQICAAFDVPVFIVAHEPRPRLHRLRWAMRSLTGYRGASHE